MQHTHIHTHIYLVDMRKMFAFKEMIDIGLFDEISSCNNCIGIVCVILLKQWVHAFLKELGTD